MKKKRILKKWVEVVLSFVLFISLVILGAEIEHYFIETKIIAIITFLLSGYLLIKYGSD